MIHLYAVAEDLERLPDVAGLDGEEIARESAAGLDLVVSRHEERRLDPTRERVLAHAQVADALLPLAAAVLPAGFGRGFDDVEALVAEIEQKAPNLRGALERVRGLVEVGLRVVQPLPPRSGAESGRAYMEERRKQVAASERLARQIHEALTGLTESSTLETSASPRLVLSAAYLADPDNLGAIREQVSTFEAAHPDFAFACTGPWPPYSFASVGSP